MSVVKARASGSGQSDSISFVIQERNDMKRALVLTILIADILVAQATESKQAQADRIFGPFNTHSPGCAVGVAQRGVVVLRSGYGMADLERNVPITADTVFES